MPIVVTHDNPEVGEGAFLGGEAEGREPFIQDALARRRQREQEMYGLYGRALEGQIQGNLMNQRLGAQQQFLDQRLQSRFDLNDQQDQFHQQMADQNAQRSQQLIDYKYSQKQLQQKQQIALAHQQIDQETAQIQQQDPQLQNPGNAQRMNDLKNFKNRLFAQEAGIKPIPYQKPPPPDPTEDVNTNARWTDPATGQVQAGMAPPGIPYLLRNRNGAWQHIENPLPADQVQQQKLAAEQRKADHDFEMEHRRAVLNEYQGNLKGATEYRNSLLKTVHPVTATGKDANGNPTVESHNEPLYTPEQVEQMVQRAYPNLHAPTFDAVPQTAPPAVGAPSMQGGGMPPQQQPQFDQAANAMISPAPPGAHIGINTPPQMAQQPPQPDNPFDAAGAPPSGPGGEASIPPEPTALQNLPHPATPVEAKKLRKGTKFVTPDGRLLTA